MERDTEVEEVTAAVVADTGDSTELAATGDTVTTSASASADGTGSGEPVGDGVGEPALFSAEQVEDMARQLMVGDIVRALGDLNREIDERMAGLGAAQANLESMLGTVIEDNAQLSDFAADAEIAIHRARSFSNVEEVAAPSLSYASAIKEFGLSAPVSLTPNTTLQARAVADVPPAVESKSRLFSSQPVAALGSTTKGTKTSSRADRMYDLFGG